MQEKWGSDALMGFIKYNGGRAMSCKDEKRKKDAVNEPVDFHKVSLWLCGGDNLCGEGAHPRRR